MSHDSRRLSEQNMALGMMEWQYGKMIDYDCQLLGTKQATNMSHFSGKPVHFMPDDFIELEWEFLAAVIVASLLSGWVSFV